MVIQFILVECELLEIKLEKQQKTQNELLLTKQKGIYA